METDKPTTYDFEYKVNNKYLFVLKTNREITPEESKKFLESLSRALNIAVEDLNVMVLTESESLEVYELNKLSQEMKKL